MPLNLLWLFLGGGLGSLGRYLMSSQLHRWFPHPFPVGTLCVNLLGCFLIGVIAHWLSNQPNSQTLSLFLITGILGGFTTFSAFGLETVLLIRNGSLGLALLYVFGSVGLGLAAVFLGSEVAKWAFHLRAGG